MLIKTFLILTTTITFFGCERSSRTVQIQPTNNAVGEEGNGADGEKPDTSAKTGKLELVVKNADNSAKSLDLDWTFKSKSDSVSIALSGGAGSETIKYVPAGSGTITFSGKLDGKAIQDITQNITIVSGNVKSLTLSLKSGGGTGGTSGETDAEITVEIISPTQPQNPVTPPVTPPTNVDVWDGKSFKGNKNWTIEAVN